MQALKFPIELLEPALVAQAKSGEPNSAIAFPFIPGSMVRGAVIRRYSEHIKFDVAEERVQKMFLNGAVCYLNAYLVHPTNGTRMLPRPLSWFVPKDDADKSDAEIYDFAVQAAAWKTPPKAPSGDFYWRGETAVQLGTPQLESTVHNTSRDRDRKIEGDSMVYRYDALAAGQVFAGVIIAEDRDAGLLAEIKALLQDRRLVLGGSQTAGYGMASIGEPAIDPNWHEYGEDTLKLAGDTLLLTCLSDVIVRGKDGADDGTLQDLVGIKPVRAFRRMRLVGGFNRTWGMPLTQDWAIEAGSVFEFPAQHRDRLESLAATGIGERRAEGFGRVAVNLNTHATVAQTRLPIAKSPGARLKLSKESAAIAQRMANRRWETELDRALIREICDLTQTEGAPAFRRLPSPAQLSRARLAARQAWFQKDLGVLTRHFQEMSLITQREWRDARIKGESLKGWILDLAEKKKSFEPVSEVVDVAGVPAESAALKDEATARLIEGVLKQAVKAAKQQAEGE